MSDDRWRVIRGGLLCDPSQWPQPIAADLYFCSDRIATTPPEGTPCSVIDATGCLVMASGIDLHTHVGGGKVNLARWLLPESARWSGSGAWWKESAGHHRLTSPVPPAWETGRRYLEMGYGVAMEPAVAPCSARQTHLELSDLPHLDTGGYLVLGNETLLLEQLAGGCSQQWVDDYVAWMVAAHQCYGVKVVNPGGVSAWKEGQGSTSLDTPHPRYGVTGRTILVALASAVDRIGLPHPLHLHCNQLGVPGNIETTLATIAALEGKRLHLAHVQFHAYGKEGPMGFSSAADRLVDALQANPLVTIDVGQVLFGQTVTLSGDLAHQAHHRDLAHPGKTILQRQELQGGCGVLPFRYRHPSFVHGLQWTVGLELFLRMPDPSRVFLTTDHPNGAPFTTYPHLMRLLTDLDFREAAFRTLHPEVQRQSELMQLKRVFDHTDLAASTRWGPAMALGLTDRGTLQPGALADVAVYPIGSNAQETYREARWVFRRGQIVYDRGSILPPSSASYSGTQPPATQPLVAPLDQVAPALPSWEARWREIYHRTIASERISGDELQEMRSSRWEPVPTPPSSPKESSAAHARHRQDRKAN